MENWTRKPSQLFITSISMLIIFCILSCQRLTKESPDWSFSSSNSIQSNPTIDENVVYFGSNDSNFYAVDFGTGKELWKVNTYNIILSKAVIRDSLVFITSGNNFFALDKKTGDEIWKNIAVDTTGSGFFDPWDYHTGSPVIYNSKVFSGFGNGLLLGYDLYSGEEVFKFVCIDSAAIRSTPVIISDVIYFGDWKGIVYAVDLNSADTLWTHRTYETQPYPTFGQVNTQFQIFDSILFFGARNPEFRALNIYTGEKIWSHTEEDGGWISGDPVLKGDTLIIGGSDNHKLFAFEVHTGKIFWTYEFLFNNFSQPFIKGEHVYFTTGDAYAFSGQNKGDGYLYAVKCTDGMIRNMLHYDGNIFSAPTHYDDKIIFGCDDGLLRIIDDHQFTHPENDFPENGMGPVSELQYVIDSMDKSIVISYNMLFAGDLELSITDFDGKEVKVLFNKDQTIGTHQHAWDRISASGDLVKDGYYFIKATSGIFVRNSLVPIENPK